MNDDELYDHLFNTPAKPTHQFLLERRPQDKPSRIRQLVPALAVTDETGQPDEPNEFETPEWEADFEAKSSALRDDFRETPIEPFYVDLFGSLDARCHLLLNEKRKWTAKSFYELEQHVQENDHVFLYNQVFKYKSVDPETREEIRNPKTYEALLGLRCIVVDIDHVDAGNIRSVIEMITSKPILPNYVNLTGNGLHLYFLFDTIHDMYHSAWLIAFYNDTKRESEREVYGKIKQKLIASFNGSTAESDKNNHLAQPSRLPGSKTKNRNKRTILFKVSDTKYSIQHIARLFGIELRDEEEIRQWKKKVDAARRKWKKEQEAATTSTPTTFLDFLDTDESEQMLDVVDGDEDACAVTDEVTFENVNSKYKFKFEGLLQRVTDEDAREQDSPEAKFYAEQYRLRAEKKARAATPEGQKRKIAQRRGLESQYEQFRQYCRDVAQHGKRRPLLHIFWNHAPWYQKDQNVIQRDFDDLFNHCNALHRTKVTRQQYNSIVNGPHYPYTKETISHLMGVELKFKNKRQDELKQRADAKDNMWKRIYLICETTLEINPRCSWGVLNNTVKSNGIDVSEKTLRTRSEIRKLKAGVRHK